VASIHWGASVFSNVPFEAAFGGGFCIVGHIAGPAVQQAVVGTGGARVDVLFFHDDTGDTPQGQVPCQPRTGGTGTNDQNVGFQCVCHSRIPAFMEAIPKPLFRKASRCEQRDLSFLQVTHITP
jgi:hypothetical protein